MTSFITEDTQIQHCQTQLKQDKFCYTWNIVDFWNIYKFKVDVFSSKAKNSFKFRMSHMEENEDNPLIYFCCFIDNSENIKKHHCIIDKIFCYSVLIKADEQEIARLKSTRIHMEPKNNCFYYLLYPLPVSRIPQNNTSPNMTLTVYIEIFTFDETVNKNIYSSHKRLAMTDTNIHIEKKPDILNQEENFDPLVTFVINQQHLEASKNLLCTKSKVFEAMFNDLKESSEVQITDTEYDILKELLFFVRAGYLSQSLDNINASVSVLKLFIAADKYGIQDLKIICEQYLITCTSLQNVVKHLKIAYLNNGNNLANYAKSFIKLYFKVIMNKPEFIALMQMYPKLLIDIKMMQIN